MQERTPPVRAFWRAFQAASGIEHERYDVVRCGDSAALQDELAGLILSGRKRATASLVQEYADGVLPKVGDLVVVLDGAGRPVCVWRTSEIRVAPLIEVDAAFGKTSGLTRGLPLSVTVLKLKDAPDAAQFKLMSFEKDAKTPKSAHIEDALGMQYVTLMVADLTPFVARIEAAGVPFLGEPPVPLGDSGNHFVLVQDPDGTFIELIGPMK